MRPLKIVIFEDEYLLANDLKSQIQQFNYQVIGIFRKAEAGLKFLQEIQQPEPLPDIVLMDIALAGKMSGLEAASVISEKYNVALVFLTGMSQIGVFEEACKSRPHAFLIKPFDVQQALVSIRLAYYQKSLENRLLQHQEELEEKIAERTRELKLSKDMAEEEIRRKCATLDNLEYQVHEPLTGLLNYVSSLKENFHDKKQVRKLTQKIEDNIHYMDSILDNFSHLKERS